MVDIHTPQQRRGCAALACFAQENQTEATVTQTLMGVGANLPGLLALARQLKQRPVILAARLQVALLIGQPENESRLAQVIGLLSNLEQAAKIFLSLELQRELDDWILTQPLASQQFASVPEAAQRIAFNALNQAFFNESSSALSPAAREQLHQYLWVWAREKVPVNPAHALELLLRQEQREQVSDALLAAATVQIGADSPLATAVAEHMKEGRWGFNRLQELLTQPQMQVQIAQEALIDRIGVGTQARRSAEHKRRLGLNIQTQLSQKPSHATKLQYLRNLANRPDDLNRLMNLGENLTQSYHLPADDTSPSRLITVTPSAFTSSAVAPESPSSVIFKPGDPPDPWSVYPTNIFSAASPDPWTTYPTNIFPIAQTGILIPIKPSSGSEKIVAASTDSSLLAGANFRVSAPEIGPQGRRHPVAVPVIRPTDLQAYEKKLNGLLNLSAAQVQETMGRTAYVRKGGELVFSFGEFSLNLHIWHQNNPEYTIEVDPKEFIGSFKGRFPRNFEEFVLALSDWLSRLPAIGLNPDIGWTIAPSGFNPLVAAAALGVKAFEYLEIGNVRDQAVASGAVTYDPSAPVGGQFRLRTRPAGDGYVALEGALTVVVGDFQSIHVPTPPGSSVSVTQSNITETRVVWPAGHRIPVAIATALERGLNASDTTQYWHDPGSVGPDGRPALRRAAQARFIPKLAPAGWATRGVPENLQELLKSWSPLPKGWGGLAEHLIPESDRRSGANTQRRVAFSTLFSLLPPEWKNPIVDVQAGVRFTQVDQAESAFSKWMQQRQADSGNAVQRSSGLAQSDAAVTPFFRYTAGVDSLVEVVSRDQPRDRNAYVKGDSICTVELHQAGILLPMPGAMVNALNGLDVQPEEMPLLYAFLRRLVPGGAKPGTPPGKLARPANTPATDQLIYDIFSLIFSIQKSGPTTAAERGRLIQALRTRFNEAMKAFIAEPPAAEPLRQKFKRAIRRSFRREP